MGVYADPSGVEVFFYDKEGKNQIRESVRGKGLLHSQHRTDRRKKPDPIAPDYSLGSTDWLTDVMIADSDDDLAQMTAISDGACLTSTCSRMVQVQWNVSVPSGETDSDIIENCVTLAIVGADEDPSRPMPTKKIYVFPEGTNFGEGHPFFSDWQKTIDLLQSLQVEISPKP